MSYNIIYYCSHHIVWAWIIGSAEWIKSRFGALPQAICTSLNLWLQCLKLLSILLVAVYPMLVVPIVRQFSVYVFFFEKVKCLCMWANFLWRLFFRNIFFHDLSTRPPHTCTAIYICTNWAAASIGRIGPENGLDSVRRRIWWGGELARPVVRLSARTLRIFIQSMGY